jgi:hypothetical protein
VARTQKRGEGALASDTEYALLSAKAFQEFVPTDQKLMKPHLHWLRGASQNIELTRLIVGLEKKLPRIKHPILKADVTNTINNLKDVERRLKHISNAFDQALVKNKNFYDHSSSVEELKSLKSSPNKQLYRLSEMYDGPTKLHEKFKELPNLVPPGIKKDIGVAAIRQRIRRYEKEK